MIPHIEMTGPLEFDSVVRLRKWGEQHIAASVGASAIQFDLTHVERCDSSALALLIAWKRYAKHCQVQVDFIHLPPALLSLAAMCNCQEICQSI